MPESFVRVDGAFELQRAFKQVSRGLGAGVKEALESAAEPVRSEGSTLIRSNVSGMARSRLPWWKLRTGVTAHAVYIAPEQRGVKSGRINDRRRRPGLRTRSDYIPSMEQALEKNRNKIVQSVQAEIGELIRIWGRSG